MAALAGMVGAVGVADGARAAGDALVARHHLHILIQLEAAQHLAFFGAPAGALLVPDAVDLLGVFVGGVERRPVEILIGDRRQPIDVHPGGVVVVRPDIDGGRERHEAELDRLVDLLDLRRLLRQRVDKLLGGLFEQVDALLSRAGAGRRHGARIVEHHRHFQRVLQPHLGVHVDVDRLVGIAL